MSATNEPVACIISTFIRAAASAIEKREGDRFDIVAMLRCFAKEIEDGEFNDEIERAQMSYVEQLRFCSEHGFICLEYCRRHGVAHSIELGERQWKQKQTFSPPS